MQVQHAFRRLFELAMIWDHLPCTLHFGQEVNYLQTLCMLQQVAFETNLIAALETAEVRLIINIVFLAHLLACMWQHS